MKAITAVLMAAVLMPVAAVAQEWQAYTYPDPGFAIQFPEAPAVERTTIKNATGVSLPMTRYAVRQDHITYVLSVVNYSSTNADALSTIVETQRSWAASGKVTAAAGARVNRYFGRKFTLDSADGSRSAIAIFFVNKHLYTVVGQAFPPDTDQKSGDASRFQDSLRFPDDSGGFGGFFGLFGGGGGGGFSSGSGSGGSAGSGSSGAPSGSNGSAGAGSAGEGHVRVASNLHADATCAGKSAGDAVQLQTPGGPVPAVCTLVARPIALPDGSADKPPGAQNPVGQQRTAPTP